MFRLTHQDRYGSCFCGVYLAALDLDVKDNKNLRIAAARLSAYEDTGLMPEQITALQAEAERLRAENAAYKADIEAGRLVRLPVLPGDELWYDTGYSYVVTGVLITEDHRIEVCDHMADTEDFREFGGRDARAALGKSGTDEYDL